MTCNVPRPYSSSLKSAVPAFSRVRSDMIFMKGDLIELFAFTDIRPLNCEWRLSRNMVTKPFLIGAGEIQMDQSVRIVIPEEKLTPGFYDVNFTVHASMQEKTEKKITFGYRIDEIPLTDTMPDDFEQFWADAKKKLDDIPLNVSETFIRDMDDAGVSSYNINEASIPEDVYPDGKKHDKIKLYKVDFDSAGGKRIYGWFAVPAGEGPFPGMLVLPGAGCGALPAPVEHARQGYAALMIQIHGMDVDLEKYETPSGYGLSKTLGEPEKEYFYNVYLACVQSVRFLESHPLVDPEKLAVVGGSQGGHLSIVTAALCPQIGAVVSAICWYAYKPLRNQVAELNREKLDGSEAPVPPPFDRNDPEQNSLSYYDTINFAPFIKAPTLMLACLNDGPSPVPTVHAVFRRLGCAYKSLYWSAGTNHDLLFAFERTAWRKLDSIFRSKAKGVK